MVSMGTRRVAASDRTTTCMNVGVASEHGSPSREMAVVTSAPNVGGRMLDAGTAKAKERFAVTMLVEAVSTSVSTTGPLTLLCTTTEAAPLSRVTGRPGLVALGRYSCELSTFRNTDVLSRRVTPSLSIMEMEMTAEEVTFPTSVSTKRLRAWQSEAVYPALHAHRPVPSFPSEQVPRPLHVRPPYDGQL
jgi:hypothetical protein